MITPQSLSFTTWTIDEDRDGDGLFTARLSFAVDATSDEFLSSGTSDPFRSAWGFRAELIGPDPSQPPLFLYEDLAFRIRCDGPVGGGRFGGRFGGGFGNCRVVSERTQVLRFREAPVLQSSDLTLPATYRYFSPLLLRDIEGEILDVNPAITIRFMGGTIPIPRIDRIAARVTLVDLATGADGLSETSAFVRGVFEDAA